MSKLASDRNEHDLANRLREITSNRTVIDVAQFQFIGLADIALAYGEKWPAQNARIRETGRTFLRKRVGASDVIIEGADGFLLVFGAMSGKEAEIAALGLSHELNEFFLGGLRQGAPSVGVQVRSMQASDLVGVCGNLGAASDEPEVNPTPPPTVNDSLTWCFEPVWDVRREALAHYHAIPWRKESDKPVPGYLFETVAHRQDYADIDERSIRASESAIQRLVSDGQHALVGVWLHATTLTNDAARLRLLAVLDSCSGDLMRYRFLKVAGVVPGFPRLYLSDIVSALKTRAPNIMIGAAWDEPDIASLLHSGVSAVEFALPESLTGPTPAIPHSLLLAKLRNAAACAHSRRKPLFVTGAIGPELATRLADAGVDNISSLLLWTHRPAPCAITRWPAERLANLAASEASA